MAKKTKKEYKFTNEYGLLILDDSPMDAEEAEAYLKFLEENYLKEEAQLKRMKLQREQGALQDE